MNSTSTARAREHAAPGGPGRAWDVLQVALFLLLIFVPPIGGLLGIGRLESEKRELARLPSLLPGDEELAAAGSYGPALAASLDAFPGRFNRFYDDTFGFRAPMISLWGTLLVEGLETSPNPVVVLGKEDWLYYQGFGALDTYLARRPFPRKTLDRWVRRADQLETWLSDRGVVFVLLLAPSKPNVYPEYVPDHYERVGERTRSDVFLEALAVRTEVRTVYPLEALRAAKADLPVFYKTDSHWNTAGAMVGCLALVEALRERWPGIEPVDPTALSRRTTRQPGGDLAALCGMTTYLREETVVVEAPSEGIAWDHEGLLPTRVGRQIDELGRPFAERRLRPGASLRDVEGAPDVLLFHDSFGDALVPWVAAHARRGVYYRQLSVDSRVVDRERPDVVVIELGERALLRARQGRLDEAIRRDYPLAKAYRGGTPIEVREREPSTGEDPSVRLEPALAADGGRVDVVLRLELERARGRRLLVRRRGPDSRLAAPVLRRELTLDHEIAYAALQGLAPGEVVVVEAADGRPLEVGCALRRVLADPTSGH